MTYCSKCNKDLTIEKCTNTYKYINTRIGKLEDDSYVDILLYGASFDKEQNRYNHNIKYIKATPKYIVNDIENQLKNKDDIVLSFSSVLSVFDGDILLNQNGIVDICKEIETRNINIKELVLKTPCRTKPTDKFLEYFGNNKVLNISFLYNEHINLEYMMTYKEIAQKSTKLKG